MTKENTFNPLIQNRLDTLRNKILEFSKAANDCSIIMTAYHAQGAGEIMGSLGHGTIIKYDIQRKEYDGLIDEYSAFSRKLLNCGCKRE